MSNIRYGNFWIAASSATSTRSVSTRTIEKLPQFGDFPPRHVPKVTSGRSNDPQHRPGGNSRPVNLFSWPIIVHPGVPRRLVLVYWTMSKTKNTSSFREASWRTASRTQPSGVALIPTGGSHPQHRANEHIPHVVLVLARQELMSIEEGGDLCVPGAVRRRPCALGWRPGLTAIILPPTLTASRKANRPLSVGKTAIAKSPYALIPPTAAKLSHSRRPLLPDRGSGHRSAGARQSTRFG